MEGSTLTVINLSVMTFVLYIGRTLAELCSRFSQHTTCLSGTGWNQILTILTRLYKSFFLFPYRISVSFNSHVDTNPMSRGRVVARVSLRREKIELESQRVLGRLGTELVVAQVGSMLSGSRPKGKIEKKVFFIEFILACLSTGEGRGMTTRKMSTRVVTSVTCGM